MTDEQLIDDLKVLRTALGFKKEAAAEDIAARALARLREQANEIERLKQKHNNDEQLWEARYVADQENIDGLRGRLAEAGTAIEADRTSVALAVSTLKRAMDSRVWMREGRGPYSYDDERYRDEFGAMYDELMEAFKPLDSIAADWSNSPATWADILEARTDYRAKHEALVAAATKARLQLHDVAPGPDGDGHRHLVRIERADETLKAVLGLTPTPADQEEASK